MPDKKLTGRIAAERIRMQSTPKPPAGAVERYLALGECTSLISDVMDELGVPEGVIGATTLKPTLPGKLIVGPALTVRNIRQRSDPLAAKTHVNRMAEFEAHNLAEDGDVLVISGVGGMSNMGGISSYTGQRQGERGAIVIVVAHRPIGIEAVDQLLVLKDGKMQAFGPKEQVLGQVLQRVPGPSPIKVVSEAGVAKS